MGRSGGQNKKSARFLMTRKEVTEETDLFLKIKKERVVFDYFKPAFSHLDEYFYYKMAEAESEEETEELRQNRQKMQFLSSLLHPSCIDYGQDADKQFVARYRLLLAQEILRNNPQIHNLLEACSTETDIFSGASFEELTRESKRVQNVLQSIRDSNLGSLSNLIAWGEEEGLKIEKLPEGIDERSLLVNGTPLIVDSSGFASGDSLGIGGNIFQKKPLIEMLDALSSFKDLAEELSCDDLASSLQRSLDNLDTTSDEGKVVAAQIEDFLQGLKAQENIFSPAFAQGIRGVLFEPGLENSSRSRQNLYEVMIHYTQLTDDMALLKENIDKHLKRENLSKKESDSLKTSKKECRRVESLIRKHLGQTLEDSLEEARKTVARVSGVSLEDFRDDSGRVSEKALLAYQNFHDALSSLNRSKSINSSAAWSYLSEVFSSDDPTDWRKDKRLLQQAKNKAGRPYQSTSVNLVPEILTRIIYGTLIVDRDPGFAKKLEQSYTEEEELRLRASLRGQAPKKTLHYLPSEYWAGNSRSAAGLHFPSNPERPSYVFLKHVDALTEAEVARRRRAVAVHELIHSGQRPEKQDLETLDSQVLERELAGEIKKEDVTLLLTSINEALTEALTQARINPNFAQKIDLDNIPPDAAYPEDIRVLLRIFDIAGLKQDERENYLDEMNAMDINERLKALRYLLRRRKEKHFSRPLTIWARLLKNNNPEVTKGL